jgi:hypothetical protein
VKSQKQIAQTDRKSKVRERNVVRRRGNAI